MRQTRFNTRSWFQRYWKGWRDKREKGVGAGRYTRGTGRELLASLGWSLRAKILLAGFTLEPSRDAAPSRLKYAKIPPPKRLQTWKNCSAA